MRFSAVPPDTPPPAHATGGKFLRLHSLRMANIKAKLVYQQQMHASFRCPYAPVIVQVEGKTIIKPLRYTCRLSDKPAEHDVHRIA